ncbi:hypothetical protein B484DRAFT_483863, partial [Ochromonadaceae sp. CCMP2298]
MAGEAVTHLNTPDKYFIDDIMSGVLILGNLYKRVGNEKSRLERDLVGMGERHVEELGAKNIMIDRLESAVLRLQQEVVKLTDAGTEAKVKHNHRVMLAMKELKEQGRRLMEVPRMEEQYQRNARSVVRQQEVSNAVQQIEWRKLEDDVKALNFWKNTAKSLDEK